MENGHSTGSEGVGTAPKSTAEPFLRKTARRTGAQAQAVPQWTSCHGSYYGEGGAAVTADLLQKISFSKISFAISSSPALIAALPASIA
jgi:hypothetical protein